MRVAGIAAVVGALAIGVTACVPGRYVPPRAGSAAGVDWVALGDSYSAGTGLGLPGLDCDRDGGAYPNVAAFALAAQGKIALRSFRSVACSGASTDAYWNGQATLVGASVAPQRNAVTREADVVTLTLGGNDIGFVSKVVGCVVAQCTGDVWSVTPGAGVAWDAVRRRLSDVFLDIRRRMSPTGHLFVLTYPALFALDAERCPNGPLTFTLAEQRAANALATRLGDVIAAAAATARHAAGNVHVVDWRLGPRTENAYVVPAGNAGAGQAFAVHRPGDGLCNAAGRASPVNNLSLPPTSNVYHPNATGYAQAANLLVPRVAAALTP
jgi:lysophospholipase L1-like esterase